MKQVGFIGLGIMGKPMARNLLKAGYPLTVYDIIAENCDDAAELGARVAGSPAEVAADSEVIVTMLPNSPHVRAVLTGESGVLEAAAPDTLVVDMSSIAPGVSQELHTACAEKRVHMLDAPVSGGEPKAVDGTLSIMVGGAEQDFEEAKELLSCMGASVVHCGEIGAGNTTKLANQIIVALNIAAVSEAFLLAVQCGVNPQTVFDAIRGGLAGSTVMDAKIPMILDRNFQPGFKLDLHIKDLDNAVATGHGVGAPLPLTVQVMEMVQTLHADGCGQMDHSAIAKYYEKLSGQEIG